jgi:hypothetical protein
MIGRPLLCNPADVPAPVHQVDLFKGDFFAEGKVVGEGGDLVVELVVALHQDRALQTVLVPLHRVLKVRLSLG